VRLEKVKEKAIKILYGEDRLTGGYIFESGEGGWDAEVQRGKQNKWVSHGEGC
jgi:hypothetical protein